MNKPTLLYFPLRGRAEIIRLVLAEAGVDYAEHPIGKGTPPREGRPTDLSELASRGDLPFGAVPVWEEPGGFRLAQSAAIANHLARRHGLRGTSVDQEARCDELLGAVDDVRVELRRLRMASPESREAVRAELTTRVLPRWLGFLDAYVARHGAPEGFATGASLTVADLALWYVLELLRDEGFGPQLEVHPRLTSLFERIARRPRIAAYLASPGRPKVTPPPR